MLSVLFYSAVFAPPAFAQGNAQTEHKPADLTDQLTNTHSMESTTKITTTKTLVLGGTGKTGSRVAQRLMQGGWPVRIGSRAGQQPFDWHDNATWEPALQGIHAVYITFQPDLAVPGAVETIRLFAGTAVQSDVQHTWSCCRGGGSRKRRRVNRP